MGQRNYKLFQTKYIIVPVPTYIYVGTKLYFLPCVFLEFGLQSWMSDPKGELCFVDIEIAFIYRNCQDHQCLFLSEILDYTLSRELLPLLVLFSGCFSGPLVYKRLQDSL